jgi:hypothetical protein
MKGRATFEPRSEFDTWLKQKYDEQKTRTVPVNETAEE